MKIETGPDGQPYLTETIPLDVGEITIIGRGLRQTNTGPHGTIGIALRGGALADHTFNLGRDDERVRIVNSAYMHLKEAEQAAISKPNLKLHLDNFCRIAWRVWNERVQVEELQGDLTIRAANLLIKPYIVDEGGTIFYGPPGRGKSFLMLAMAVSLNNPLRIPEERRLWAPPKRCPIFVNLERSRSSLQARLARVNSSLGLPPETSLRYLQARGMSIPDVMGALRASIQKGSDMVFIDSLSRSGMGDLNENTTANGIIDQLNGLSPVPWVAIGHPPKGTPDELFGSVMFKAGADVIVRVKATHEPGHDLGMVLEFDKGNDIPVFSPEFLGMHFDADGLARIYRAKESQFPELINAKRGLRESIQDYLTEAGASTATQIADAIKRDRTQIVKILQGEEYVFVRQEGRSRFYDLRPEATP